MTSELPYVSLLTLTQRRYILRFKEAYCPKILGRNRIFSEKLRNVF